MRAVQVKAVLNEGIFRNSGRAAEKGMIEGEISNASLRG
jgi:hypothetical protein